MGGRWKPVEVRYGLGKVGGAFNVYASAFELERNHDAEV